MDVSTVSNATTGLNGTGQSTGQPVISSNFETFLKMLTVQMQNQNPLDPVKSEDFAVQLATFSGVEQQVLTNNLLEALIGQNTLNGMAEYAGWVGMEARAPTAAYFEGSPIEVFTDPPIIADAATLVVYNSEGVEVDWLSIPPDESSFHWDGIVSGSAVPSGHYRFVVESSAGGEQIESRPAEVYSRVVEAQSQGGSVVMIDAGGWSIPVQEITALRP